MPEAGRGVLMLDDESLVALARAGERLACEELFLRHRGVAYSVAYRLLGHEQDALDAVQEGLLKAFASLGDFDGRSGFRTWLIRIVTNAALDAGRRRRRRPTLRLADDAGSGAEPATHDDPASGLRQQDLRRHLNAALDRLSPTTRVPFVLFAEAGLSYKEIAEIQGIPIGTVMSRIFAARQKLQSSLDLDLLDEI